MTGADSRPVPDPGRGWSTAARVGEIQPGSGRVVSVDGRLIAVFNCDGRYYAIDNRCPHRGGPLGKGVLTGTTVVCPWHGWSFDVTTGINVDTGRIKVACFPVALDGDWVGIRLGDDQVPGEGCGRPASGLETSIGYDG